ncbi:MAG: hypothetical protein Q7T20_05950 [Saprospiraceae bacterium]|nr:hypothetical protein [Saprospiraceae bacterium]
MPFLLRRHDRLQEGNRAIPRKPIQCFRAGQERSDPDRHPWYAPLRFFRRPFCIHNVTGGKEADTAQVRSAYTSLGINVNAEYLPNLTDYPICLLKEQAIGGYTSARKAEETVINAALDNGDDNINSIVNFPFWKTALNADRAVHIGNRIYKYYDNGG